jgi:hypothetical protein
MQNKGHNPILSIYSLLNEIYIKWKTREDEKKVKILGFSTRMTDIWGNKVDTSKAEKDFYLALAFLLEASNELDQYFDKLNNLDLIDLLELIYQKSITEQIENKILVLLESVEYKLGIVLLSTDEEAIKFQNQLQKLDAPIANIYKITKNIVDTTKFVGNLILFKSQDPNNGGRVNLSDYLKNAKECLRQVKEVRANIIDVIETTRDKICKSKLTESFESHQNSIQRLEKIQSSLYVIPANNFIKKLTPQKTKKKAKSFSCISVNIDEPKYKLSLAHKKLNKSMDYGQIFDKKDAPIDPELSFKSDYLGENE